MDVRYGLVSIQDHLTFENSIQCITGVLRKVENDWKKKKKRSDLDSIGRARPSLCGKYATGNLVIKVLKNCLPLDLNNALHRTLFTERRRPQRA